MSGYVVGVTGGIGSGKTTIGQCFSRHNVTVVDTDQIAHELTAPEGAAMPAIRHHFGNAVVSPNGAMDRVVMRRHIFADPAAKVRLEEILHPLIRDESRRRCADASSLYVLLLIPLLNDKGTKSCYSFLDRVLFVDCDEAIQIQRVMQRSLMSETEVRAIIAAQPGRAERLALADDVVANNGSLNDLEQQMTELHRKYEGQALDKVKATC